MFGLERELTQGGGGSDFDLNAPPPSASPNPVPSPGPSPDPTTSLRGDGGAGDEGTGSLALSPMARGIAAVSAVLQGINELEGLAPGFLTPQFIMEASLLQTTIPEYLMSVTQGGAPSNLLAAAVPNAMGGSASGMGAGGAGAGSMMMPGGMGGMMGAGAGSSGLPPTGSLAQSAGFGSASRNGQRPF